MNKITSLIGYGLGAFLSFSLMIVAAVLFLPQGIDPQFLGTPALGAADALGKIGLILALVGILFAVGGAAIETSFSGAYNVAQFFGWQWGKRHRPSRAPRFTLSWIVIFILALAIVDDRLRPGEDHRVLRDLLRRRAAADVSADPARRERPDVHGPLPERQVLERARRSSTSS